jgi:hypothetical protein
MERPWKLTSFQNAEEKNVLGSNNENLLLPVRTLQLAPENHKKFLVSHMIADKLTAEISVSYISFM